MGLYRDKRACPKNLSPLEHNRGIEGLATGLASKVISILSSWVNCLADSGYGVIGRILQSARTRTGLCMCKNKVSFHTKNNISFVLFENM